MKIRIVITTGGSVNLVGSLAWVVWTNPPSGDGLTILFAAAVAALGSLLVFFLRPEATLRLKLVESDSPLIPVEAGTEINKVCNGPLSCPTDTMGKAA